MPRSTHLQPNHTRLATLAVAFLLALALLPTPAPAQSAQDDPAEALEARLSSAIATMSETGDFRSGAATLDQIADDLIGADLANKKPDLIRRLGVERRLAHQMASLEKGASGTYAFLRTADTLREDLALAITEHDDVNDVYQVLARLRHAHPDTKIARNASLAAAICVVHDEPVRARRNENTANADAPEDVFGYYERNASRMQYGIRGVPVAALVYVVDAPAPVEELEWALRRYKGNRLVGKCFHEIRYDNGHFKYGREKALNEMGDGYTLENIKRHGGVCVDQAHFAATVGKAIGVPTAYVTARGPNTGHAWVGYLRRSGRNVSWDFDEGRWEDYEDTKGTITDPQTGRRVSDGHVGLTALYMQTDRADRILGAALIDLSERPATHRKSANQERPEWATLQTELELLEAALRKAPADSNGWERIRDLGVGDELSTKQKSFWSDVVLRLCGRDNIDFAWEVMRPMIETVEDVDAQAELWEWAGKKMRGRHDLEAEALLARGRMWEQDDKKGKAWSDYREVAVRYVNDGPASIEAATRLDRLASSAGDNKHILDVYEALWRRIDAPGTTSVSFYTQSNYYQLGSRYAAALDRAGRANDARRIRDRIDRSDD